MKFVIETLSEKLFCNELNVKQYKDLLKCSYGDEPDKDIFCETVCDILSCLLSRAVKDIKQFNIIDIALAIVQLKINSQGNVINVAATKDDKKVSLEIDLNYIVHSIISLYKPYNKKYVKQNEIELQFSIPCLQKLLEPCEDEYLYFLNGITIKDKAYDISTVIEAEKIFNSLSPKLSLSFIELYKQFATEIQRVNFLEKYKVTEILSLTPSLDAIIWYTKLLFSEPLNVFYNNMFYLAHLGHIDIKSLETLSPGEYIYMVKMLESTLNKKDSNSSTTNEGQDISSEEFDDSGMFENKV